MVISLTEVGTEELPRVVYARPPFTAPESGSEPSVPPMEMLLSAQPFPIADTSSLL